MTPATTRLCVCLRTLSRLLRTAGETHWAAWMDESRARIEHDDPAGIEHLLGAYGGMGSFNDLILTPDNGHTVEEADVAGINDRLDMLRSEIYVLAHDLRHDAAGDA